MKITEKHVLFFDGIFSNFYPCTIMYNKTEFKSSEQLFMWFKAIHFSDHETAFQILKADTPREAKALGRKVLDYNDEEWSKVRERYMRIAVHEKFMQNTLLREDFLSKKYDGKTFAEASPWDSIWGIKLEQTDPRADDESQWNGLNLLGKVLDDVRASMQKGGSV
jgi:ribA/ribD-fused uncharacterized protein